MAKASANLKNLKLVIFCGGTGTRMWPMSRENKPKQFQALAGNKSMFRQALDNFLLGFEPENIFISTGKQYFDLLIKSAPEIPQSNYIIEPEMRDTAAAVGYAAAVLSKKFPGCTVMTRWGADHVLKKKEEFIKVIKTADKLSQEENAIIHIDTRPTYPNVNLGYVEIGRKVKTINGYEVFEIKRQVEKPNLKKTKEFIKSGNYLWHTGCAVWKVDYMLSLYKEYAPEVFLMLQNIKKALGTDHEREVLDREFPKIPKISLDYLIYEKLPSGKQLDIPADLGWSDIGAWNILKDELSNKPDGNVEKGQTIILDTKDSLIYSTVKDKIVATIGLNGLIIVDTADALLICPKERSQDVKKIVERLKEKHKTAYL